MVNFFVVVVIKRLGKKITFTLSKVLLNFPHTLKKAEYSATEKTRTLNILSFYLKGLCGITCGSLHAIRRCWKHNSGKIVGRKTSNFLGQIPFSHIQVSYQSIYRF